VVASLDASSSNRTSAIVTMRSIASAGTPSAASFSAETVAG